MPEIRQPCSLCQCIIEIGAPFVRLIPVEESIRPSTAPVGGRSQVGDPATMMDAKNTFYNAMNNKTRTIQNTSVGKLAKYYTELMLMFRALFVVSSFFSWSFFLQRQTYTLITTPATFCLTDLNLFKAEGVNHLFVINFESLFALLYVSIKRRGNDGIPGRFDDVPRNG